MRRPVLLAVRFQTDLPVHLPADLPTLQRVRSSVHINPQGISTRIACKVMFPDRLNTVGATNGQARPINGVSATNGPTSRRLIVQ